MKSGANFQDRNRIKRLSEKGLNAEEISEEMQIELRCVCNFVGEEYVAPEPEIVEDDGSILDLDEDLRTDSEKLADEEAAESKLDLSDEE